MLQSLSSGGLPRLKDGKVVGVADEDAPEEPQRQEPIEGACAGESFWESANVTKDTLGNFEWADLQVLQRHGRIRTLCSISNRPQAMRCFVIIPAADIDRC